jgi:transposase-like protein
MNELNMASATAAPGTAPQPGSLTADQKAELVQKFLQSGLGLREFSRQHGIGFTSLHRWVRKEQGGITSRPTRPGVVDFTELKLPARAEASEWAVELTLPNGTVLRMTKDTPPAIVEQLLRVC